MQMLLNVNYSSVHFSKVRSSARCPMRNALTPVPRMDAICKSWTFWDRQDIQTIAIDGTHNQLPTVSLLCILDSYLGRFSLVRSWFHRVSRTNGSVISNRRWWGRTLSFSAKHSEVNGYSNIKFEQNRMKTAAATECYVFPWRSWVWRHWLC